MILYDIGNFPERLERLLIESGKSFTLLENFRAYYLLARIFGAGRIKAVEKAMKYCINGKIYDITKRKIQRLLWIVLCFLLGAINIACGMWNSYSGYENDSKFHVVVGIIGLFMAVIITSMGVNLIMRRGDEDNE